MSITQNKPQQQTLSIRVSDSLREFLELSRQVIANGRGDAVSMSDVARILLESAKEDRLDFRLEARHGPYHSLTQAVKGKTRSRFLTEEQAAVARQQIATGREFREHVDAYWEACEQWADAQLEPTPTALSEHAEKKGSKRSSKSTSSRKSKRS